MESVQTKTEEIRTYAYADGVVWSLKILVAMELGMVLANVIVALYT